MDGSYSEFSFRKTSLYPKNDIESYQLNNTLRNTSDSWPV